MTPTFLENKQRIAVIGTPGGSRIITMVMLATLAFNQSASAADIVAMPRFHHQYLPDHIQLEPGATDAKTRESLEAMGHKLQALTDGYGNMQVVDPLTLYLLTMLDLRSGALADEYGVIDRDRLRTYRTQMLEQATTATPIGELATLAISRQRPDSRKAMKLWHAPTLGFLPVQVSKTKDGAETSRLTIERLTRP